MIATSICVPQAGLVPGSSGPPDWIGGSTHLDDQHWGGDLEIGHGQGGPEHATFRAIYAFDHSSPPNINLYLSWLVRVDPNDLGADLGRDALHVGFSDGQQSAIIRVQITGPQSTGAGVINDSGFALDVYLWDKVNHKWGSSITQTPFGWIGNTVRVWTRQPFDNTPAVLMNNLQTNQVPWGIQMQVPVGQIIPASITGGSPLTIGNQFSMWYSLVVKTPTDPTDPNPNQLTQYTWPEGPGYDITIDPVTRKQNFYPDPATWGTVNVNNLDAACTGIAIDYFVIGTDNTPSSYIDPGPTAVNVIFAEPLNRTGDPTPLNASDISAKFRLWNHQWGTQAFTSPEWSDIRTGTPDDKVAGDNTLTIPNGNTGGPGGGKHYISFKWTLDPTKGDDVAAYNANPHQCMLVQLFSSRPDIVFIKDSVVRNMDFTKNSVFSRAATVSVDGLTPPLPAGRDVYLYVVASGAPSLATLGREANPGGPILLAKAIGRTFTPPELANPTYIVHAFHDTGKEMLVGDTPYRILHPQSSYGYFMQHDGPLFGWAHRLEGAERITPNFYKLSKVPNHKSVKVSNTIEALEQPRGARDSGFMVQSNIGDKGDFEVIVPHEKAGLVYCSRNNDTKGFPWGNSAVFAQELGLVDAVSVIQSNFGNPGNLEVVARVQDKLFYLSGSDFIRTWNKPVEIASGIAGNPALIQGRYGNRGNFELVVPLADGGIAHYWRNNDDPALPWHQGGVFAKHLGKVDAVALIQSNIQDKAGPPQPGHLEVIARVGDDLLHLWRNDGPNFEWMDSQSVKFYEGATGIPGFIQSNFGGLGNFEVVTPSVKGGMAHLERNNDDPKNFPWRVVTTFGSGNVAAVSLLQSNFTTSTNPNVPGPGDFEIAARVDGRTALYWRRDLAPLNWGGPQAYACS